MNTLPKLSYPAYSSGRPLLLCVWLEFKARAGFTHHHALKPHARMYTHDPKRAEGFGYDKRGYFEPLFSLAACSSAQIIDNPPTLEFATSFPVRVV